MRWQCELFLGCPHQKYHRWRRLLTLTSVLVCRLERLQRLAEKVHRDCRTVEDHLDDIDKRIMEVCVCVCVCVCVRAGERVSVLKDNSRGKTGVLDALCVSSHPHA